MSPHPASAATCVLTRATVPGVPAEPAALASTASACLSRTPSSLSAAFFLESGMSNVCHSTAPVLARVGRVGAGAGGTAADLTEDGRMMAMGARPGGGVCLLLLTATALVRKLHPIPPRPLPYQLIRTPTFQLAVDECSALHSPTAAAASSYLVHVLRTILVPIICPRSSDQEAARWNAGTDGAGGAGRWRRGRGDGMQDSLAG